MPKDSRFGGLGDSIYFERLQTLKKRLLIFLLIFVSAVVIIGGLWFLASLGPKTVDYSTLAEDEPVSEEVLQLREASIELEAQFEEILILRDPNDEDLKVLKSALDKQIAYIEGLPRVDGEAVTRRDYLEKRFQDIAASGLMKESEDLQREGERLAAMEDFEGAQARYLEAHALQNTINQNYPRSDAYNLGRATRLQRQSRFLQAEPILRRSQELEASAEASIEDRDWVAAEEFLREAMALQDHLNRDYRGTNQASVSRFEQLNRKLVGIRSGQSYVEIENLADLADQRRLEGENLEAAGFYLEAARLQRQLNENYRESRYASTERAAEFERKSQTAASYDLGLEIERKHALLNQLLMDRKAYEASEVIVSLRSDLRQMQESYARSSLNDEELQTKVRYLNLLQSDFGYIQDRVYDALLPIPDEDEWQMLRSEVPQALFTTIMGSNPSRSPGDLNPVDSVSWTEAQTFCRRLSWILGRPVRLPTEDEFRQALGRLRYVVLEEHVWSAADSDGNVRPVATKKPFASGYYDLLGNVSEWLESADRLDAQEVRHIGGHVQDRLEAIFTVPVRQSPRAERNRMTGFRFVVKVR